MALSAIISTPGDTFTDITGAAEDIDIELAASATFGVAGDISMPIEKSATPYYINLPLNYAKKSFYFFVVVRPTYTNQ